MAALFLAGLGVVIGNRMSTEAMGVVVGVVLGVAASIPMTLLVMLFLARSDKRDQPREEPEPPRGPVVILPRNEYWTSPPAPRERLPGQLVSHNGTQCIVGADGGLYPLLPTGRQ